MLTEPTDGRLRSRTSLQRSRPTVLNTGQSDSLVNRV
jgi:hypothetical protein